MNYDVYYAHSMKIYDSKREKKERKYIESFCKSSVLCPNRDCSATNQMSYYFNKIDTCDRVVCSEYQGHIGKGVYLEIKYAQEQGKHISCIRRFLNRYIFVPVLELKIDNSYDWKINYAKVITDTLGARSYMRYLKAAMRNNK